MKGNYGLTPEEVVRIRKRNKNLVYASIFIGVVVLSALITILANRM